MSSRRVGQGTGIPRLLWVPAMIGLCFLLLPLLAILIRTPWTQLADILTRPGAWQALRLSFITASCATGLALFFGVPLAWILARVQAAPMRLVRALVTVPLVLPPVVGGVALLLVLGRRGLVGQYLDLWFGFTIPFTTLAVVLAQTFVAMPFLIISVEGAFRTMHVGYEDAAATLGASRWSTFWRVTLPLVAPGVGAGAVLAFARALGEFGATITFAGNYPGTTRTMPIAVYLEMDRDPDSAIAMSLTLLLVSIGVLLLMRGRWVGGPTQRAG